VVTTVSKSSSLLAEKKSAVRATTAQTFGRGGRGGEEWERWAPGFESRSKGSFFIC